MTGTLCPSAEIDLATCNITVFSTQLGWMALAWRDALTCGLVFGHTSSGRAQWAIERVLPLTGETLRVVHEGEAIDAPPSILALIDDLQRFAAGEPVDFNYVAVDEGHLTPFARRVTAVCRCIPWGQVRTYGEVAAASGSPGAARAVGQVMAGNRYPLIVPCHRVLASGGALGGFSAPQGLAMKRRLLTMER